ncbi:hypothetical protein GN156_10525 [bacterium LRH843]|nr:hypothetical protein [bacterium LRH843]
MFRWMKRGIVISSALLTIGLFEPVELVNVIHAEEPQKAQDEKNDNALIYKVNEDSYELFHEVLPAKIDHYIHRSVSSADILNSFILKEAYRESMNKFGETIGKKIGQPFEEMILPQLDAELREVTNTLADDDWSNLKISSSPGGGFGEKILHVYNESTGEDIFRFHVRRDQPPNQGYYFNFHYHTYLDQHEKHHDLGTIFWGKDMPPKWSGEDRI